MEYLICAIGIYLYCYINHCRECEESKQSHRDSFIKDKVEHREHF